MDTREQTEKRRVLAKMWRQWSNVVRLFAQPQRTRELVNRQAYHKLYTEMLAAIRELKQAGGPCTEKFLSRMEGELLPWLTVGSFQSADRDVICRLMLECGSTQKVLDAGCGIRTKRRLAILSLFAGIALMTVTVGHLLGEHIEFFAAVVRSVRLLGQSADWCVSLVTPESAEGRFVLLSGIGTLIIILTAGSVRKYR